MLEAVIENHAINLTMICQELTKRSGTIGIGHDRHVAQAIEILRFLVAALAAGRAVAAHTDDRTVPMLRQQFDKPDDHWRLADAARSKVAHGNDRAIHGRHAHAAVEARVSSAYGQPIEPGRAHGDRSEHARQRTAHISRPLSALRRRACFAELRRSDEAFAASSICSS